MTRTVLALICLLAAGLVPFGTLSADVLLIEEVRQADRMDVPDNGVAMADVRAQFGEPVKEYANVGDPPITRWEYDRWSVYFEHDLVLFTVLHKGEVLDSEKE